MRASKCRDSMCRHGGISNGIKKKKSLLFNTVVFLVKKGNKERAFCPIGISFKPQEPFDGKRPVNVKHLNSVFWFSEGSAVIWTL